MSFVEFALKKNGRKHSHFGMCSATDTQIELINGNRYITKRPKNGFAPLTSYMDAFNEEIKKGKNLDHPNILKYLSQSKDEHGIFIVMETEECATLQQSLKDHPASLTEPKVADRIINEILDAVEYLHKNGLGHFNLDPTTILLTRHGQNVKLINPASFYMNCTPPVMIGDQDFSAPELYEETTTPDIKADIYSIGHIIDYIFTYSILPIKYKEVIKHCTASNPTQRYNDIQQIRKAIKSGNIKQKALKIAIGVGVTVLVSAFAFSLMDDMQPEQTTFVKPAKNSEHTMQYLKNDPNAAAYNMLADSIGAMTEEEKEQQIQYEEKARKIINKKLTQKTQSIINKMYTSNHLDGDEKDFKQAAYDGFGEIQKITEDLAREYGMDPNDVANMAKDVVKTLTQKRMQEIETSKKTENN